MSIQELRDYIASLPEKWGFPEGDCAVWKDDKEVMRQTYGTAKGDEIYWLFSCTKPITATLTLRLIEEDKLGLDDPVEKYLPAAAHMTVRDGDTVRDAKNVLTVRHLLSMRGGFDYDLSAPEIRRVIDADPEAPTRAVIEGLLTRPLCFEPGTHFQYSLCHDVLAAVLEAAGGDTFGHLLKKYIFDPLGMTDTGFVLSPAQEKRMVKMWFYDNDAHTAAESPCVNGFALGDARYESGGAGLFSTTDDYGKFLRTLANYGESPDNGYRLLTRESVDLLRVDQLDDACKADFKNVWRPGYSYGCGVRTMVDPAAANSASPIGEFGWDGACGCYLLVSPEKNLCAFYAQQIGNCGPAYADVHLTLREAAVEL